MPLNYSQNQQPIQQVLPTGTQVMTEEAYAQLMADAKKAVGRPDRPEFESLLGEDGLMGEQYQLQNVLNQDYLGQMRQDALRAPGEQSQWRQLMEQNIQGQAGQAAAGAQAQTQNAMSNLAMRGGLRGGAAERLTAQGAQQATQAQQNVLGQRLQLDIQDEQMRQGQLQNLGQAELGAAGFQRAGDQFNIQTSLNETLQQRAEAINAYNEQMRAWASERSAAAAPSGGGGKK